MLRILFIIIHSNMQEIVGIYRDGVPPPQTLTLQKDVKRKKHFMTPEYFFPLNACLI